jgi:hypothetical protein
MEKEILILIIGVLLAFYNGQFLTNRSKQWHTTGWVIRALLMVVLWPNMLYMAAFINVAWLFYDIIINLYLNQKWWYTGKNAFIDKYVPFGIVWSLKGLFFVILLIEIYKAIA